MRLFTLANHFIPAFDFGLRILLFFIFVRIVSSISPFFRSFLFFLSLSGIGRDTREWSIVV